MDDEFLDGWRALAERARQGRDADAEDHVQDAVVAALDALRRNGRGPEVATAWLRTVARRRAADEVRRALRDRRVVAESASLAEPPAYDAVTDVLDRHEARWLAAHVDRLPATTREVVHALASGATQADVAGALGLTPRAVEAHVRRARLALRRVLDRAGTIVAVLARRRRRVVPAVVAAGLAAAVGMSLIGSPDTAHLLPIPRPPRRIHVPDRPGVPLALGAAPVAVAAAPPASPAPGPVPAPARRLPQSPAAPTEPVPDRDGTTSRPPTPFVLVPSDGSDEPSSQPLTKGAWYDLTVAGVYSYNKLPTGLADCGHYQPEGKNLAWDRYHALWIDGAPAPCDGMPYTPAHVYRWQVLGTGRPLKFRVADDGGGADNLGQLVVTLTALKATATEVLQS
jgi:RNA polymerase sigma factor (sigma-70 family)